VTDEAPRPPLRLPLRDLTPARVALGRAGVSLPTAAALRFAMDHALARDAVHAPLDRAPLDDALRAVGLTTLAVESAAPDRAAYLARPDLGRRLSSASHERLGAMASRPSDLAIVAADGLSSRALEHVPTLLARLLPVIAEKGWSLAPVAVALQGRVALGDEIARLLRARMVLMLIGERPGPLLAG
jgi:ethanolamine ammonia-lyase small subunit